METPGSTKSRKATVTGPDGQGLAGVTGKAFVFQQNEPVLDTQTDAKGYFLLPNGPPGEELLGDLPSIRRGYRLQISKPGYLPWQEHLFVTLDHAGNYGRQAFLMRKSS
ncbi:hypothetical protein Q31b_01280 [Novipirellula aureliae]|uniref:PEGA domain protein n=1 Tax=Novipirellula aureliae TaxID=2527966 RepID=A0A5C6EAF7_9BACT|nr:carboxypeptidase-like regulatory domain-containing protein [Novipirellula aureliae]TWU44957.1 hypothetical protein Q31b_01280 [Novipirellula aureliae]